MKDILLKPHEPNYNDLEVDVLDFPKGTDKEPRWRMTIVIEYAKFDVEQLKKEGMDLEAAMNYYEDWLYKMVRASLLNDWTAVGGLEETLEIVRDHIKDMFEA